MTPITRQDVLAHQAVVPWGAQYQVEQDLLLCRAMAALFDDKFLSSQIAMRGGTLLHKVHLAPPARYSEDIDLVVGGTRPADHIRRAIRRVLTNVLGTPKASVWDTLVLAIRNTVKPSRVLRMTYSARSILEPNRTLEIVVEANVTERKPHRGWLKSFSFPFRVNRSNRVQRFRHSRNAGHEMRAMFQRTRGRDFSICIGADPIAHPVDRRRSLRHSALT
jgi:predicted nucleotidyltransferase component of viral defense system